MRIARSQRRVDRHLAGGASGAAQERARAGPLAVDDEGQSPARGLGSKGGGALREFLLGFDRIDGVV